MDLTKILKDVPQGTALKCLLFKDPVTLHSVSPSIPYPITATTSTDERILFSKEGYYSSATAPQNCMLYPLGMDSWDNVEYIPDGRLVVCERNDKIIQIGCAKGGFAYSKVDVYWWYDLESHTLIVDTLPFYFDKQVTELEELKVRNLLIEEGYKMVGTKLKKISEFKEGDIIVTDIGFIVMFDSLREGTFPDVVVYKALRHPDGELKVKTDIGIGYAHNCRFATEKEKNMFFNSLAEAGYFYDGKNITQTFKKGDIVIANGCIAVVDHVGKFGSLNDVIYYQCCINRRGNFIVGIDIGVCRVSGCEYASDSDKERILKELSEAGYELKDSVVVKRNKFNFDSFTEFDKVLVRDSCKQCWRGDFFQYMEGSRFACTSSDWTYCIPYNNDTKFLVGTSMPAPEFYRK